ncbi:hypothetical protein BSFA1_52690 [Burkholderia sp. SFA1]|nr:hypothetical protein BSFA1_52690 [Burkholderia sp. SFA1]
MVQERVRIGEGGRTIDEAGGLAAAALPVTHSNCTSCRTIAILAPRSCGPTTSIGLTAERIKQTDWKCRIGPAFDAPERSVL